jgi:capsular exopolysaccharide synthesis family protein
VRKKSVGKHLASDEKAVTFGPGLNFAASEAYRLLRANILFALPDHGKCRVIGITSALSGEGKSTTALNLAYVLAESGRKTLLLEADMRLPVVGQRLGLVSEPGLSNLLAGLCGEEQAVRDSGLHENLWVMPSGDVPPNPSELLDSGQMKTVLGNLRKGYDFILLDLPPVNEVSDALVASQLTDGTLVVVRQGHASRSAMAEAMRQLQYAEVKILGFVMNYVNNQDGSYYKKGYGGKQTSYG